MKYKILISYLLLSILTISCGTDFSYTINKKRLINNLWKVNTYVDYNQNNTVDIRSAEYSFNEDGTLTKVYDNNDTILSVWQLSDDGDYLTIGSNTFKVTELTNRVMSLRYGDVEMFFVSLN